MKLRNLYLGGTMLLGIAVMLGCNSSTTPTKGGTKAAKDDKAAKHDDHGHGTEGPHGGTLIEFGPIHAEFTVDHKTKEATIYILGEDAKTAHPIAVDKLLLSIKSPQFQADAMSSQQTADPKGKSSRFVAKHDNFGKEQEFEGTLSGVIEGKPYAGDFKEEEHKDHKHDKK